MKIFNVIKETHIPTNISFKVRRHIIMICSFISGSHPAPSGSRVLVRNFTCHSSQLV